MYDTMGYDSRGHAGGMGGSGPAGFNRERAQQEAEEIFRTVQEDFDIVQDALMSYGEEIKDEINVAIDAARRGDWQEVLYIPAPLVWSFTAYMSTWPFHPLFALSKVLDVASSHKGLIFGIVLPSLLFFRYPPAVFAVMRVGWAAANLAVAGLLYTNNLHLAASQLWKRIVKLSLEQKRRAEARNSKGGHK